MGRSKRDALKRTLAQAMNNTDKAMIDVLVLKDIFTKHHPELAQSLEMAATTILLAQQIMEAFAQKAWEIDAERLKTYR